MNRAPHQTEGDTVRLFIAIQPPDSAIRALETLQDRLRQADPERVIRWGGGGSFHLTLKFLGDVPTERVSLIGEALSDAVKETPPLVLTLSGVGGFPMSLTPHVVWAGIQGDLDRLNVLQQTVESAIARLGFPREGHEFSPHLTLGRARQDVSRRRLAAFGQRFAMLEIGDLASWQAVAVNLMRSDLRPMGAIHTQLAACPLKVTTYSSE